MMKRAVIITLCMLALSTTVKSQYFGVQYKHYNPKGAFDSNVNSAVNGFSLSYLHDFEESRWSLGGEFGIAMYANENFDFQVSPGNIVELHEEDCFWTLHGEVRYNVLDQGLVKTYLSGRVGITTFFSSITPVREGDYDGKTEFHGTAFNAGLGVGAMLNLFKLFSGDEGPLYLDTGINFHSGSKASYRYTPETQNTLNLEDGKYYSLTNYTDIRVGLLFGF